MNCSVLRFLFRFVHLFLVVLLAAAPALGQLNIQAAFPAPKRWAVVIGASQYQRLPVLEFSGSDSVLFRETLLNRLKFDQDKVAFLSDQKVEGIPNVKKPTNQEILATLDEMLANRQLDQGNLFVFYFSGHGFGTKNGDYLMPIDAGMDEIETRGLPVRLLVEKIVQAGMKNVLFVVDACREGAKNPFGRELQALARQSNIALILSCAPGQRSYEDPRAKQGFFTHALVQVLNDETKNNGISGSLWASDVAQRTSQIVSDLTTRRFGRANRQTPTIWAEKSRDVLVGNFPSIAFRDPGLKEIWLNDAKNKDSAAYASLLTVLSYGAAQAGDIRQSVELMRTLDALGEATPFTHLFLGVLLLSTGREQEAEQQFARVMSSGDSYDRDQAILLSRKPTLKRQDRADAAIRIWRTTKEAIDVERMMSLQLSDSRSSLWKEVFDGVAIGSRKHSFLSALKLQLEDKPAEALQTIKGASDQPGDDPPLSAILGLQFECAQKVGDVLLARKTIVQALDQPRDLNLWLYRYLTIAQGDPLESKVAVAKAVIDLATAPVLVSRAVLFVPEAAQELESNLRAASERLPFSPEILLCTWAIQYSQAWDLPITFPEVLARESDSEAFLTWNAWRLLLEIYQAQLRAGTLRSPKAGLVNDALIELTSRYPSELRQRPLDYMMMVVVYAPSGRASQLGFMQRRFLLDKFVQSEADPRFRAVGLYSACLAGDLTTARAIFADGKWAGAQVASFTVVYATSLAMAGFEEEAKAALSFVLAFEGSAVADEKASLLYYLGLEGLKKEPQSTNGKVLAGLARAKRLLSLKDVPKQDLQAGFQDAVAIQKLALSTSRSDLRAKALATVTDFRIKLDETQGAASDPLLSDPLSLEGHRSFADLPWMTPTQIADCVGDFVFQGKMRWDGEEAKPVKLELRVGSDGNWTGEIKGGEYRLKMTGSVNRYGYLLGKSEEGHELQGRLLPRTIGTPIARVTLWSPLGRQASVTNLSLIAPGN